MEATRPVQQVRRTRQRAQAPRESTQDCTGCGATIAPVDQFYGEEGVRCLTCGALHHEDCWALGRRCATFGCDSTRAAIRRSS